MSEKHVSLICLSILFGVAGCQKVNVSPGFESRWSTHNDRIWLGEQYWANRLQDWQLKNGRVECINSHLPKRTLHLLNRHLWISKVY